jgi:hypothetical protein
VNLAERNGLENDQVEVAGQKLRTRHSCFSYPS